MPIREHTVMLCEMIKGVMAQGGDVGVLMRGIGGSSCKPVWGGGDLLDSACFADAFCKGTTRGIVA